VAVDGETLWVQFGPTYQECFTQSSIGKDLFVVDLMSAGSAAQKRPGRSKNPAADATRKRAGSEKTNPNPNKNKNQSAPSDSRQPKRARPLRSHTNANTATATHAAATAAGGKASSRESQQKAKSSKPKRRKKIAEATSEVTVVRTIDSDTVRTIAAEFDVAVEVIMAMNKVRLPGLKLSSSFIVDTELFLPLAVGQKAATNPVAGRENEPSKPSAIESAHSKSGPRPAVLATKQARPLEAMADAHEHREAKQDQPAVRSALSSASVPFSDGVVQDMEVETEHLQCTAVVGESTATTADATGASKKSLDEPCATGSVDASMAVAEHTMQTPPPVNRSPDVYVPASRRFTPRRLEQVPNHSWVRDGPQGTGWVHAPKLSLFSSVFFSPCRRTSNCSRGGAVS
jgi:hypothetical protein